MASEIQILRSLSNHPRIVQLRASYFCRTPAGVARVVLALDRYFISLTGLAGGADVLAANWPCGWQLCISIQILEGLNWVHAARIVHRDLKPCNLMMCLASEAGTVSVRISDFGSAIQLPPTSADSSFLAAERCVTTYGYAAPEVLANLQYYTRSDIWSFSIILIEMTLHGRFFRQKNPVPSEIFGAALREFEVSVHQRLLRAVKKLRDQQDGSLFGSPQDLGSSLTSVSLNCMELLPLDRPTAAQALGLLLRLRGNSSTAALPLPAQDPQRRRLRKKTTSLAFDTPIQGAAQGPKRKRQRSNEPAAGSQHGPDADLNSQAVLPIAAATSPSFAIQFAFVFVCIVFGGL